MSGCHRLHGKLDAIEEITRASFSWGYVVDKKGDFSCEVEAGGFVRESQGQSQITRRSTTVSLEILFIDLQWTFDQKAAYVFVASEWNKWRQEPITKVWAPAGDCGSILR